MKDLLEKIENSIDIPELEDSSRFDGIVLYTDGGSRVIDRRIRCGYGIHAYTYKLSDKVKVGNYKGHPPTAVGYRPTSEKEHSPVQVVDFINLYGDGLDGTNNVGELLGLIVALMVFKKYGLENKVETLVIRSDSEYVIQGTNKQIDVWEKNGYKRSDGELIKNLALWRIVSELKDWLVSVNVKLDLQWVKGHVDVGNIKADKMATMGVFSDNPHNKIITPYEVEFKTEETPSLLIQSKLLYYPGTKLYASDKRIYTTYNNSCAQDDINELGRNLVDSSIGLIILDNDNQPKLDKIEEMLGEIDNYISYTPKVVDLDFVLKNENMTLLERVRDLPIIYGGKDIIIETPNKDKLVTIIDPPRTSYATLENLKHLLRTYLCFKENPKDELFTFTEITDKLFEVNTDKKGKVTHKHINADQACVYADIPLWKSKGVIELNLALTFGLDLPPHRVFFNLKDKQPSVHVLTWYDDECISYFATVIECQDGIGIWCAEHTNTVFTRGT